VPGAPGGSSADVGVVIGDQLPGSARKFEDAYVEPADDYDYWYRLVAVDKNGNRSDPTRPVVDRVGAPTAPTLCDMNSAAEYTSAGGCETCFAFGRSRNYSSPSVKCRYPRQRASGPTALASFLWRMRKVQNRFALSSRAEATCRLSNARMPSLGPYRRPRSVHTSKAVSGTEMVCQIRAARSSWKSRWSRSASVTVICRRNTCCAMACVHRRCEGA
jgi:hypothetical protein